MVRASLLWLLAGTSAGAMMMSDEYLRGHWRLWMGPTHGHVLFVGWFLQFALGIAIWLLPRSRSPLRPLGYRERRVAIAVVGINLGLILRVIAEPAQRSGHRGEWTDITLVMSALFQVVSVGLVIVELWPRIKPRVSKRMLPEQDRAAGSQRNAG